MISGEIFDIPDLQRRLRVLLLVDAAERALLAPLSMPLLHLMAYLTNVLAPVWAIPVLDGKLLKKGDGPFYPALQADADAMVGQGLLIQSELTYVLNAENQWRLQGVYTLNHKLANPVLEIVADFPDEQTIASFCSEVAYGLSALLTEQAEQISKADASYGDPLVDYGSVLDFAEWNNRNYAANAATRLGELLPSGTSTTAGEKIHAYVRHLGRRIYATG